jgi:molybdenum cofactor cytidylyltransferase
MEGKSRICGVILSAGASSRMGRDKALLPWPPAAPGATQSHAGTLLSASIEALKPFAESVIVVAGKNAESLAPIAAAHCALLVENPAPDRGQFSSLQVGLSEVVARGFDAAMITLVDCPPLRYASLQRLSAAFDAAIRRGMWGVAPEHGGKHGHPLIAGRALVNAFLAAPATSTTRAVRRQHDELIEFVTVPDVLLTVDMNTPDEYAALALGKITQI